MTSVEQLLGLSSQALEIEKRVVNGTLNPLDVRRALQDIIEHRAGAWRVPPTWWRTPEQQMERARELWPGVDLPEPPRSFIPHSKTSVLLLHVPSSFDELWGKAVAPEGFSLIRNEHLQSDRLLLAANTMQYKGPKWIEFDPEFAECGHSKRDNDPYELWKRDDVMLAADEVLSAVIQFPDWAVAWIPALDRACASRPHVAGYKLKRDGTDDYFDIMQLAAGTNPDDGKDVVSLQYVDVLFYKPLQRWASPRVYEVVALSY